MGFIQNYNDLTKSLLTWSKRHRFQNSTSYGGNYTLNLKNWLTPYEMNSYGEIVQCFTFVFCHMVSIFTFYIIWKAFGGQIYFQEIFGDLLNIFSSSVK